MASTLQYPEDEVRRILSQDSFSTLLSAAGVRRADGARLPSNYPCEDRYTPAQSFPLWGKAEWTALAVFDGHNGWQLADHLQKELLKWVRSRLEELPPRSRTDAMIQETIEKSFTELDDAVLDDYRVCRNNRRLDITEKIRRMQLAMSGSCALLCLYNPSTRTLYTACTGDSRALLGQQNPDGTWFETALSTDQDGKNEAEMARIREEHPDEEAATRNGKVLGMSVTRSFGNFLWKSSHAIQLELGRRFFSYGALPKEDIPTPPYLIARPVVTVRKLREGQPAFLVAATDGFWDSCTNRAALELVVRWLETQSDERLRRMGMELQRTPRTVWWKCTPRAPPEYDAGFDFYRRGCGLDVRFCLDRTTVKDLDNVAVHLLRNACGGSHDQLVRAKLAYQPPYSRVVRDDMTVQVLLFE